MMAQGVDVSNLLQSASTVIEMRQKGKPLHQAIQEAMKPPEPPEQQEAPPGQAPPGGPAEAGAEAEGMPGQPGSGIRPSGLPQGVAPGQIASGPGGMPGIMSLIAEMKGRSGSTPNMQAGIMRKIPTGG